MKTSIENIIKKATAKNPKNRYDTAGEMHEDLLTALDDSRMDEEEYQYKYPENEGEGKKKSSAKAKEEVEETEEVDEDIELTPKKEKELDDTTSTDLLDEKEEKTEKKKKIAIIVLGAVFGVLLLVMIIIFFVVPKLTTSKNVVVPNCKGKKVSVCEKALQKAGFEVNSTIKSVASDKVDKNLVVKTNPEAGRSIKKGSKITIYKSSGDEKFKLEDYTGENAIEVKTILETKYGLSVTIEKKDPDDNTKEYDDNEVIDQSLAKGSEVKKGDKLILYVPKNDATFPDFAEEGYSKDDVEAFCSKYQLNCTYNPQETSSVAEGKIISQSRLVGSTVSKGSSLTVTYAVKPTTKPTTTPTPAPKEDEDSTTE